MGEEFQKTAKAVGFVLGIYKAQSPKEAQELRKRAAAEGVFLALSTVGTAGAGAALRAMSPAARVILSNMVGAGAGGAGAAAVEGISPAVGALGGAAAGGLVGIPFGIGAARRAAQATLRAGRLAEAEAAEGVARAAREPVEQLEAFMGRAQRFEPGPPGPETGEAFFGRRDITRELQEVGALPHLPPPPEMVRRPAVAPVRPIEELGGMPGGGIPTRTPAAGPPGQQTGIFDIPIQQEMWPSEFLPPGAKMPRMRLKAADPARLELPVTPRQMQEAIPDLPKSGLNREQALEEFRQWVVGTLDPARVGFQRLGRTGKMARIPRPLREPAIQMEANLNRVERALARSPAAFQIATSFKKLWNRAATSGKAALQRIGGAELAARMGAVDDAALDLAGGYVQRYKEILRGLSTKDRLHLGDVIRNEDTPRDALIGRAAAEIRALTEDVASKYAAVGGRTFDPRIQRFRPFERREHYFPIEYSERARRLYLQPGTKEHEEAIQFILSRDMEKDRQRAELLLRRFLGASPEATYGHLQHARMLSLPAFERDPNVVFPKYFVRASRRIEMSREFGDDLKGIDPYVKAIADRGGDKELAVKLVRAWTHVMPRDYGALIHATRTWNVVSMLTYAGLLQPTQWSNIAAYTSYKALLKGMLGMARRGDQDFAERAGVHLLSTVQDMLPRGEKGVGTTWVNLIGLLPLDRANRVAAAVAGKFHAEEMARRYASNRSAQAMRALQKLGLDPQEVLAQGGALTEPQLRLAARNVSMTTQFANEVLDLPYLRNTPAGQLAFMFKSFAFQQFRFIKDEVMKEAAKGNFAPMLRYGSVYGTLGASIGEVVNRLKAKERPEEFWMNYAENLLSTGAVGIAYDSWRAAMQSPTGLLSFVGGPAATEVSNILYGGTRLAMGKPETLMRTALRQVPGIGEHLARAWVPRENQ